MKKAIIGITLIVLTFSLFGMTRAISHTKSPVLSVCPNENTVCKDELFSVNVTITNVTDLVGYDFELFYNATVLTCVGGGLPRGHFLEPATDHPLNLIIVRLGYDNTINLTHGYVWVVICLGPGEPSRNGSGTLATIYFKATAEGSSILHLYDSMLANTSAQEIPSVVVDGSVTVLPSSGIIPQRDYGAFNMSFDLQDWDCKTRSRNSTQPNCNNVSSGNAELYGDFKRAQSTSELEQGAISELEHMRILVPVLVATAIIYVFIRRLNSKLTRSQECARNNL